MLNELIPDPIVYILALRKKNCEQCDGPEEHEDVGSVKSHGPGAKNKQQNESCNHCDDPWGHDCQYIYPAGYHFAARIDLLRVHDSSPLAILNLGTIRRIFCRV